jgi:hypothetical protein
MLRRNVAEHLVAERPGCRERRQHQPISGAAIKSGCLGHHVTLVPGDDVHGLARSSLEIRAQDGRSDSMVAVVYGVSHDRP